jgi:two-component system, NarL family, invasion response regulator UvrY
LIRIGIADDEELVRDGLAALLSGRQGMIVVATVESAVEAVELACSGAIDILLLDIGLGKRGGIDALEEIVHRAEAYGVSAARVLMVSSFPEEEYGVRAIRCGAAGYLRKASDPGTLERAIRTIVSGERFISPRIAELLADFAVMGGGDAHQRLSSREYQVFCALAAGRSVNEIADELSLSVSTVSTYRSRILDKLDLSSTAAIIHYAAKHGLV